MPDKKKGNRLRNTLKAASKSDAKNEEDSSSKYNADVERAFPASGVKTVVPKHKYSTMPKDKEKAKGMSAGAMKNEEVDEAANSAQQAAIAISKKKEQGVAEAQNDYFKRRKDEEDRIAGTKAPAKRTPKQTDYEKKRKEQSMAEATGDPKFDKMLKGITGKKAVAKQQKADTKQQARDAFGSMFGGGNPADKLKIKEQGVAEEVEEQFDLIEEIIEEIAEEHNVDSEEIWEDFECLSDEELLETAAWRRSEGKDPKGGLNRKGIESYRREHPGSHLQMAVTTKPSELKHGSKAWNRRKSFCARMSGEQGPMKKPNGEPTRKALALRKWHCEGVMEILETEVWDKKNPVKHHKHLSSARKAAAKNRARAAGRPYPNMIDNMWAARHESVEVTESYEEAEEHLSKANDADAKGDKLAFHHHMADHHDSMSQWHESKGRSAAADKHAEKADYHSDKYAEHANKMHEGLADDFKSMLNDKGIKHRIVGSKEDEVKRTMDKLAANKASTDKHPQNPGDKYPNFGKNRGYGQGHYMGDSVNYNGEDPIMNEHYDEEDHGTHMAKLQLLNLMYEAKKLHDHLEEHEATDLPDWIKSKITMAQDYIAHSLEYTMSDEQEDEDEEDNEHMNEDTDDIDNNWDYMGGKANVDPTNYTKGINPLEKKRIVGEAYKGTGSSALKFAQKLRQEKEKRLASEQRAKEMLNNKPTEKK